MSALGVVEVIGADTSFASEAARPTVPGVGRARTGSTPTRAPSNNAAEVLTHLVQENVASTLMKAQAQAAATPGTTTLGSLALAYELTGDRVAAVDAATAALQIAMDNSVGGLADPLAVRSALQVLVRGERIEEALRFADALPLTKRLSLEVGAALGSVGRLSDAWRFVDNAPGVAERDAVVGYLLALGEDYRRAVPVLRSALREDPNDADTALNLSIALVNIGARRKAVAAAFQARAAAPAREDIGLHYFELLLMDGSPARVDREIRRLFDEGVVPSVRLLVLQARAKLAMRDFDPAMRLLERATDKARSEGDLDAVAEVQSNLIRLRAFRGKTDREKAIDQLLVLHAEIPDSAIVVVNLAQVVTLKSHAGELSSARNRVAATANPEQLAFLDYQIATLEGNAEAAAGYSREWVDLESSSPRALAAAMVALGIGEERWGEAAELALGLRAKRSFHPDEVNNVAYVLAMAGMCDRAIQLLAPLAEQSFVARATLGLANLAAGHIDEGMRLYRRAADEAEKLKDDSRSLMTVYQALVVRQLDLLDGPERSKVVALSLPPYPLPDDWQDRPEFLRLLAVARRHNYDWPLSI